MELLKNYKKYLEKNFNPERAKKEKAYLYSDNKHYGLSAWEMGKYFSALDKELKLLPKKEAIELVNLLWNRPSHEEKMLALHVLNVHADKLDLTDMPLIEKLMRESKGWVYLDNLIIPIMPILIDKDKKGYEYLNKWVKDDDFWVRRSALLAQLLFFRKGVGDKRLFFELAKTQFDESWIDKVYKDKLQKERARFFIRKAIGWVLRDMSVKGPDAVWKFLKENKGEMSGLSYREGSRKLPERLKVN